MQDNLLVDPLIRVRLSDGTSAVMSLPEVYGALVADSVASFPALRPHQRHAWHAFLAQLGVIAIHRSGVAAPPRKAGEWLALLRKLTAAFGDDEPWRLIVDDPARPAFMQCPASSTALEQYKRSVSTPDSLDVLVTAKNHDIKQEIAAAAAPDDWVLALVDLQTMANYGGRCPPIGCYYGVARMNGGSSARPCLGLAPDNGGVGAHLFHDIRGMLERRESVLDAYPEYYHATNGRALLWLDSWDGTRSLDLRELDPYFIEICRRVRLRGDGQRISARAVGSGKPRIAAKHAHGNVGDFWTPVSKADAKALSLSSAGFRYDRLAKLILDKDSFELPAAMRVGSTRSTRWRVVARGVAGGQGKTGGYHERSDIAFDHRVVAAFGRREQRDELARISEAQIEEIRAVERALKLGVAVAASGGKLTTELARGDRMHAGPYLRRLDEAIDARFFKFLQRRFLASDDTAKAAGRAEFARGVIDAARALLDEVVETVPCPALRRHRARARAFSAFSGQLRGPRSVFSDQPEIFGVQEADHAA